MRPSSAGSGHLPEGASARFRDVVPIGVSLGRRGGHELLVLSLERWSDWTDVRFARIDHQGTHRLPRRVPPIEAWQVWSEGSAMTVVDAVGRGDRAFSNGEVRLSGHIADGAQLSVSVILIPGQEPLTGEILVPTTE